MSKYARFFDIYNSLDAGNSYSKLVHATLASFAGNEVQLEKAVRSLLPQVDSLHVFLNGETRYLEFLSDKKIFVTQSKDFGPLGECGKYYWVGEIKGYHMICCDNLVYPPNYVSYYKKKIEDYNFTSIVGSGGYGFSRSRNSLEELLINYPESEEEASDVVLPVLKDSSIAYHSRTINIHRHLFYQPEFSSFWFSIAALESGVPLVCCQKPADWLTRLAEERNETYSPQTKEYLLSLLRSYFHRSGLNNNFSDINTFLDRIYVMNLDRRPDRWRRVMHQMASHNIAVNRFSAVDGGTEPYKFQWENYFQSPILELPGDVKPISSFREKYLDYQHYIGRVQFMESKLGRKAIQTPGAWGYLLSYISILNEAIRNDFSRILIFDDDLLLHRDFKEEFARLMLLAPNHWRMIKLGAMQHHWESSWITWRNDSFYHCNGSSIASHAVVMDCKIFLPLLYYCQKMDMPVDEGAIFHIQNVYANQCGVFYPNLVIQDVSDSDINSSALSHDEMSRKNNIFRWDFDTYKSSPI